MSIHSSLSSYTERHTFANMSTQIMYWNIRGLIRNLDDISELLRYYQPKVFCVQETHLSSKQVNFLRRYAVYRKDRDEASTSSGGVAIVVDKSIPCHHIVLQTPLEAVAVRAILFNKLVSICSIYIPPHYQLTKEELYTLIKQLPEPYIIVGDFNAHNILWGDSRCDQRGRLVENLLVTSDVCLFNKKEPTYFNLSHKTYSSLDLAIGSAVLFPFLEWNVIKNPFGSDHFPITLNLNEQQDSLPHAPRWKLESADWERFNEFTYLSQDFINDLSIDAAVTYFTTFVLDAAERFIPQSNGHSCKRRVPWWNDDCKQARRKQNKAWGILRKYPTAENLVQFKQIKSQGRRIRRQARRASWQKFLSGINSYTQEAKVWNNLRRLNGQPSQPLPLVNHEGNTLVDQADALGEHFERISSSMHYPQSFKRYKEKEESKRLEYKCHQNEPYNRPFCMAELRTTLASCQSSAPGPDRIMYDMIKHLHSDTQVTLLSIYNNIWTEGHIPIAWKEAIVVPVLKQGEDPPW